MPLSASFALILALVTARAFGLSLSLPYVLGFIVLLLLISRTLLSASARAAFAQSTSSCSIKIIRIKAAHARRLPHSRAVCTGRWLLAVACHVPQHLQRPKFCLGAPCLRNRRLLLRPRLAH